MRDEAPGASPAQNRRFSLRSLAVAAAVSIAAGALAFSPVFAPSADATMVNLLNENQQSIEADPTGWVPIDVARSWRSGQAASTGSQSLLVSAIAYGFKGSKPMAVSTLRGVSGVPVASGSAYEGSVDVRAQQKATSASCVLTWFGADGSYKAQSVGAWKADSSARWTTLDCSGTAPSGAAFAALRVRFSSVSLGNIHYLDRAALLGNRVAGSASAGPTTTTAGPTTTVGSSTTSPTTTAAPATTTTTAAAPPPTTPPPSSSGGPAVNEALIPAGSAGVGVSRIGAASYTKKAGDGSASFRVNCEYSHMNFDDPIVFPGRSRATHLHIFFGNKGADASSTPDSIRTSGNSTCTGGTANRSAYWAPAVIDTASGAPVISTSSATDRENFLQVYYKTGYEGVVPTTVVNFPAGLRMIAGTSSSSGPQPGIVTYSCNAATGRVSSGTSFQNCAAGQLFIMEIKFPQCWDGVNLDSPNHKSHMAYGAGWPDKGCPSSHPVPLAQVTQNFRYRVPAGGMATWRLSSDMYSGPAGYSGHADWMNGWDAPTFQRVVTNCFRTVSDCQMNLLGDGQELLSF